MRDRNERAKFKSDNEKSMQHALLMYSTTSVSEPTATGLLGWLSPAKSSGLYTEAGRAFILYKNYNTRGDDTYKENHC